MGGVFVCGIRYWTGCRGTLQIFATVPANSIRHCRFLQVRQAYPSQACPLASLGIGSDLRRRGSDCRL